jgi:hypothetical protein
LAKIALFLTLLVLAFPAAAQRVRAQMDCRFTGTDFVYDCLIRLAPATPGVNITVNADMPSMPMAHNLKPVKATPGKLPGEYRARLDLDMTGEWAVKLRTRCPRPAPPLHRIRHCSSKVKR